MKILIAWELGNNYGHILTRLPLARMLISRGHKVTFAVRDIGTAASLLIPEVIPFVQAPIPRLSQPLSRELASYADILAYHGFGQASVFHSLITAWMHLIRCIGPDVIILDHSPAALIAGKLMEIPTISTSTGFDLPPPISPYPSFRPYLNISEQMLMEVENGILSTINKVAQFYGATPFGSLSEANSPANHLLVTFSELDHYPQRKNASYLGSLFETSSGVQVQWPSRKSKNIFVYLRHTEKINTVLTIANDLDANVICVAPEITQTSKEALANPYIQIFESHVQLAPILLECDLIIANAGHGIVSAALLHAIPILSMPLHIEHRLLADCIQYAGIGRVLTLEAFPVSAKATILEMLKNSRYKTTSLALAQQYIGYHPDKTVEKIIAVIESYQ